MSKKAFSAHFIILVFGQVVSIIGNSIVGFSLTLYLLDATGSAAIFGTITAISALPWAIAGPIGGIMADKFSKKKIMVTLDFITSALIFTIAIIGFDLGVVIIIGVTKFILSTIQSMYAPSVSSSLVYLVEPNYLVKANSLTSGINSLARVLGPVLAGVIYSIAPIEIVLYIGGAIFFVCAVIECFMKIPKISLSVGESEQKESYSVKESFAFLIKENKYLFRFLCCVALAGLSITSIVSIGLPFIVNIYLDLPSQFYGTISAVASIGSLGAGTILFIFPNKLAFRNCGYIYIASGIILALMGLALYIATGVISFVILCGLVLLLMVANALIYILMHSFIQKISPPKMLGKIMSCVTILAGFCDPLGQILYGRLFDMPNVSPDLVVFVSGVFVLILSGFAARFCKKAVGGIKAKSIKESKIETLEQCQTV